MNATLKMYLTKKNDNTKRVNFIEEFCRVEEAYVTPVISQSIDARLEILAQKIALNSYKY